MILPGDRTVTHTFFALKHKVRDLRLRFSSVKIEILLVRQGNRDNMDNQCVDVRGGGQKTGANVSGL